MDGFSGTKEGVRLLVPAQFKKNHFNFIRMAMALLVIWSHSFAIYYGTEDHEPISMLLNGAYNAGNIGVRVFFIVSGFLITASFVRSKSLGSYLRKRVARIFPGFIVAVAICGFVVVPLVATRVDLSASAIAKTVLMAGILRASFPPSDAFAVNPVHAVNGALWSIPYEFWCYLAVAGLGIVKLLQQRLFILVAMLGIMAVKVVLDILGKKPGGGIIDAIIGWQYLWFSIAPCFLAGMVVYLYRDRLPRSRALAVGLLILFIASAHLSKLLCDALFPIVTAYLTFYLSFSRIALPDAARFGDFSYGTYLYGFPIQQILVLFALPFMAYVPAAIFCSVAAGVMSWFLVEKRFLVGKHIEKFSDPVARAAAAATH